MKSLTPYDSQLRGNQIAKTLARSKICVGAMFALVTFQLGMNVSVGQIIPTPHGSREAQVEEARSLSLEVLRMINKGEYDRALPSARRVLEISEAIWGGNHPSVATALVNIGYVFFKQNKFESAADHYKRGLDIYEKTGMDNPDAVIALNNFGLLKHALGDRNGAEPLYRRAIALQEKSEQDSENVTAAIISSNLGRLLYETGKYEEAGQTLKRAITILEKSASADKLTLARTLNDAGLVLHKQGEWREAELPLQRAINLYEHTLGTEHFDLIPSLNNLALVYQSLGDLGKAEPLYQRALRIYEKSPQLKQPIIATLLENLSVLRFKKNDIDGALDFAGRAAEIEEHNLDLMLATGSENQNLAYWLTLHDVTMRIISLHLREAPNNEVAARLAFTTVLRRKGRVLDSMVDNIRALRKSAKPADKSLLDRLSAVRSQLADLLSQEPNTGTSESPELLPKLAAELERLEALVSAHGRQSRVDSEAITTQRIQRLLPPGAALIEFVSYAPFNHQPPSSTPVWPTRRYAVYVLQSNGKLAWTDLGEAGNIDDAIGEFRIALRNPRAQIRNPARKVYDLVMRPVRRLLGDSKWLIVSPDVTLQLIPFEALAEEESRY